MDEAFAAPNLKTVRQVFGHEVRGPVLCTPLTWKPSKLKQPIFRRCERTTLGNVTSDTRPVPYSQLRDSLVRLGKAAGFQDTMTNYCFRRGMVNAMDSMFTPVCHAL